jgi:hypothetical protein
VKEDFMLFFWRKKKEKKPMKLEELKAAFDGLSEEANDEFLAYVTEDEATEEAEETVDEQTTEETVEEPTEEAKEEVTEVVDEPTEETAPETPVETPEEPKAEPDHGIEERLARIEAALAKLVEEKDPLAEKREKYGVATRPVHETHAEFTDRDIDRLLGR